jgi:hypothetical protein
MNTPIESAKSKLCVQAVVVWAACVLGSVIAAWAVGKIFNYQIQPALVVVISSALAAVTVVGTWPRKPRL